MDREPVGQFFEATWEAFRNSSSETIPAHSVIVVTGVTSYSGRAMLLCNKPTTYGAFWGHRITGPSEVGASQYGMCRLSGIAAAACDTSIRNPGSGEIWGPRSGSWKLWPDTPGFRILEASTTGIAYVCQQPQQTVVGKTDAAHNKASTGTVSVYWSSSGGTLADTGQDITAYNRYGNVAADKFVTLNFNGWGWEIIAAECGA